MFVGVSISSFPFILSLLSFLSWSCLSHLSLLFLPSPFISRQQPLTARQCFECQFLLYFRKTCNYPPPCQISPLCFVSSSIGVCPLRGALHELTCWWHSFLRARALISFLSQFGCICVWLDGLDGGCQPLKSFRPKQWTVAAPRCIFTSCALRTGIPAARCIRNPSVWTWLIPPCTRPCPSASTPAAVRDTPAGNHAELRTCKARQRVW